MIYDLKNQSAKLCCNSSIIFLTDKANSHLSCINNLNDGCMRKLLLIKEIYIEGFRNLGHILLKRYFKAFSWFCFALLAIVIYAFVYRLSTGFAFD